MHKHAFAGQNTQHPTIQAKLRLSWIKTIWTNRRAIPPPPNTDLAVSDLYKIIYFYNFRSFELAIDSLKYIQKLTETKKFSLVKDLQVQ